MSPSAPRTTKALTMKEALGDIDEAVHAVRSDRARDLERGVAQVRDLDGRQAGLHQHARSGVVVGQVHVGIEEGVNHALKLRHC